MSDDLCRHRAIEEDCCVITAIGAGLVKGMNFDGVHVSLTEEQRRFVRGKIEDGEFRRSQINVFSTTGAVSSAGSIRNDIRFPWNV